MNRRVGTGLVVVAVAVSGWGGPARAGLVTWQFEGVVTAIEDDDGVLTGLVDVGSPFSASITFDPDTPDSSPSSTVGFYEDAISEAAGAIGAVTFLASGGSSFARVFNDDGDDSVDFFVDLTETPPLSNRLGLGIFAPQGMGLEDDSLPLLPIFTGGTFRVASEPGGLVMEGTVTSIVPEPGCLALVLAGALLAQLRLPHRFARSRVIGVLAAVGALGPLNVEAKAQWAGGPVVIGNK